MESDCFTSITFRGKPQRFLNNFNCLKTRLLLFKNKRIFVSTSSLEYFEKKKKILCERLPYTCSEKWETETILKSEYSCKTAWNVKARTNAVFVWMMQWRWARCGVNSSDSLLIQYTMQSMVKVLWYLPW